MKEFVLKPVDQDSEVMTITKSIEQLKNSIVEMDKDLEKRKAALNAEKQKFYELNVKKELGKVSEKSFAEAKNSFIQLQVNYNDYFENEFTIQKNAKAEALTILEGKLRTATKIAYNNLHDEIDLFIKDLQSEASESVEKLKPIIKELRKVLVIKSNLKRQVNPSAYSTLPFYYEYFVNSGIGLYNRLTMIELIGSDKLNGDMVYKIEGYRDFID